MAKVDNMFIANLAFLLDYNDGTSNDEIESEIFKVAFQIKESIHYDRSVGAGFQCLEQEPSNISVGLKFSSDLIMSVYTINAEKGFDPYIVVGFSDITINNEVAKKSEEYIVDVKYRLLKDLMVAGKISI